MAFMRTSSNASSGMGVAPDIRETFLELQMKKAFRYVIFKIEEKQKQVVVEKTGATTESYDDFLACLPENDCRYALYDFDFVTGENVQKARFSSLPGPLTHPASVLRCCTPPPRTASSRSSTGSTMRSRQLTRPRWSSTSSATGRTRADP